MRNLLPLFFLGILAFLAACGEPAAQSDNGISERINLDQLDTLSMDGVFVLDVRTPEEFAGGAIPGAVNIDWNGDDFAGLVQSQVDKNKPVLVYCAAGGRSRSATAKMVELGYQKLYDLGPGYSGWEERHK